MIICARCGKEINCKDCEYYDECKTRRANEITSYYQTRIDNCYCSECAGKT